VKKKPSCNSSIQIELRVSQQYVNKGATDWSGGLIHVSLEQPLRPGGAPIKEALVIHPRFTLYGGGEVVGLHVCKVLQELGYHVQLACDNFNPEEADRHLGLGSVMEKCAHVPVLGEFRPFLTGRFLAYQRAIHGVRLVNSIKIPENCEFVFSTQSMLYFKPNLFNFCIAYDHADFFYAHQLSSISKKSMFRAPYYYPLRRLYRRYAIRMSDKENYFIPLSLAIEQSIEALHYPHSPSVFPPCEMSFSIRPKEKYVVNTSRIVPSKRLEDFVQVARQLPHYKFVIVGKMSKTENSLFPDYKQNLLDSLPSNAKLVEALIREVKELVENAKLYLYPSIEPGVSISLGQAMGAGCIPVTPSVGGGAEMVKASGVGYTYRSLNDAPEIVKQALESDASQDRPEYVAQRAQIFNSDTFDERIRKIIEERLQNRNHSTPEYPRSCGSE
jgi:glycosyltransferase involved in cell wall biosynthesis